VYKSVAAIGPSRAPDRDKACVPCYEVPVLNEQGALPGSREKCKSPVCSAGTGQSNGKVAIIADLDGTGTSGGCESGQTDPEVAIKNGCTAAGIASINHEFTCRIKTLFAQKFLSLSRAFEGCKESAGRIEWLAD